MHRGIIGRVLVALGVLVLGVAIIARAPIGAGSKPKAAPPTQGHAVVALRLR